MFLLQIPLLTEYQKLVKKFLLINNNFINLYSNIEKSISLCKAVVPEGDGSADKTSQA